MKGIDRAAAAFTATLFAVALAATGAHAQKPPGPNPCAEDPHFREFDFWLGTWKVTSRATGTLAGENVIRAIESGCAVEERWTGKGGSTGTSLNYYNPLTGRWRQVWVAAGAYSLDISGGLNDEGQMVLEGTIHYYRRGTSLPFRGTWTPNADGSVRQHFEQIDPQSGEWADWFDGLYERIGGKEGSD